MILNLPLQTILTVIPDVKRCSADLSLVVQAVRSLGGATAHDLAIVFDSGDASVFDPVSLKAVQSSAAGVVIASCDIPGKPMLVVADPLATYNVILAYARQHRVHAPSVIADSASIHPSAVIEPGAVIGRDVIVHALAYVGRGAKIDEGVVLHPGAKVLDDCIVGKHSIVQANAVIGADGFGYEVTKKGMRKLPHVGTVVIGKGVEVGANCMIDRALFEQTEIGDGVKLDNGVHIAHNVRIGASTAILAQTGIAGSVVIGRGCQIGGQVAIKDHVIIGDGVKIVSKSAVMNDVASGQIVCGIPAISFSQWKRITVSLSKLPDVLKLTKTYFPDASATPAIKKKQWWRQIFGA
jgi:UDP-3-O-[3-hydroxymyristoyl] glucosamine N-acyltransferase